VKNLNGKVRNLENVLEEMHKAAENRREIERQHKEALVRTLFIVQNLNLDALKLPF
jgi:hypothetical protein